MSTILVVEDGITDREAINRYLKQNGFNVINAESGEEALEKLNSNKPDAIVIDVILPGQSGFELCRELKTDPKTKNIPVIICSSKNTDVDKTWGNMLGADAYITKPVDETLLLQTVRQSIAA
ncbi:CheY subfamily protein [Geitlerinema sp. FC II]|uniref:response regulator transcription factor n=1 Tax=Baaleninema simplex TaxID=2862350 RepID=UPI00034C8FDA|nr:response regulator [Baaleninema simplex]MDC0833934.1 response regulator [Geitlerinema sp. CS-897]PPT06886.1 CheY subfamily protein [Geitlerinema sp. FC II]